MKKVRDLNYFVRGSREKDQICYCGEKAERISVFCTTCKKKVEEYNKKILKKGELK